MKQPYISRQASFLVPGCCLAILGLLALPVLFLLGGMPPGIHGTSSCLTHLKQVGLGFRMYMEDSDQRLPPSLAWNEEIMPYINSMEVFRCPQEANQTVPSYAWNNLLQNVNMEQVETPEHTVMTFDSIPGKDLTGGSALLPSPPRHNGYDNIGFLDTHVKPFQADSISYLTREPRIRQKKSGAGKDDNTKH